MAVVVAVLSGPWRDLWLPQSGVHITVPEDLTVNVHGNLFSRVVETLEETHGGGTILQVAEDFVLLGHVGGWSSGP